VQPGVQVLIVDDDPKLRAFVAEGLDARGIGSRAVASADEALALLQDDGAPPPDLVLLDVMMPERDGWQLLEALRAAGRDVPVIFVTARRAVQDRVHGLRLGADADLLTPYECDELLARTDAVLRRRAGPRVHAAGALRLDLDGRTVERQGRRVELSPREFDVLRVLLEGRGRVVTRGELLERVWAIRFDPQTNVVDTTVARLRRRVDRGRQPLIETVVGEGYRLASAGPRS
jgi:DNA-binding response OmpR family regulator